MLLRGLSNIDPVQMIIQMLYFIPIVLITLTIHEYAHAYIAYKMGDFTASAMGRLSLNPLKHIDPIGFLMMIIIGFGWAKPVPINPRNFRNPKKGMAFSALAGPASNIIMAIIGSIVYAILLRIFFYRGNYNTIAISALSFVSYFAQLNVWFAVFNLIPIPPLDGSRIVSYFLPPRLYYYYNYVERYGFIVLIIFIYAGRIIPFLNLMGGLQMISGWILHWINVPINWIFSLFGG